MPSSRFLVGIGAVCISSFFTGLYFTGSYYFSQNDARENLLNEALEIADDDGSRKLEHGEFSAFLFDVGGYTGVVRDFDAYSLRIISEKGFSVDNADRELKIGSKLLGDYISARGGLE